RSLGGSEQWRRRGRVRVIPQGMAAEPACGRGARAYQGAERGTDATLALARRGRSCRSGSGRRSHLGRIATRISALATPVRSIDPHLQGAFGRCRLGRVLARRPHRAVRQLRQSLKLWEVATGKELRAFTGHSGPIKSVAFSPDGRTVLSGSHDNALK